MRPNHGVDRNRPLVETDATFAASAISSRRGEPPRVKSLKQWTSLRRQRAAGPSGGGIAEDFVE
jgi:hypothetical protein